MRGTNKNQVAPARNAGIQRAAQHVEALEERVQREAAVGIAPSARLGGGTRAADAVYARCTRRLPLGCMILLTTGTDGGYENFVFPHRKQPKPERDQTPTIW
jgi:hypothetical protein